MSKRAEEAALKAYPKEERKVWSSAFGMFEFDKTAPERIAYQKGYDQAEKDLALTWEDIKLICEIEDRYWNEEFDENSKRTTQEYYEEVLRRFNEQREKK